LPVPAFMPNRIKRKDAKIKSHAVNTSMQPVQRRSEN
jgi:hypothetical protein